MKDIEEHLARILIVDDEEHILETYRKSLVFENDVSAEVQDLHESIFGSELEVQEKAKYDLVFAQQGKEAVEKVRRARDEGRPFAVVFLDMRMPPGQGGFLTAKQIRRLDQDCNIVVVTAYSDVEVGEMASAIKPSDKFFYLRKPFYPQEIQQFAAGLTAKWSAEMCLGALVEDNTMKLAETNIALHEVMDARQNIEEELEEKDKQLRKHKHDYHCVQNAIEVLFRKKFNVQKELEETMTYNVNNYIIPYIKKLKESDSEEKRQRFINIIENNLKNIFSPFMQNLSIENADLNKNEIAVAHLISQGVKSQEIGELLGLNKRTIDYYRDRLRDKLGLKHRNKSLKAALQGLKYGKPEVGE